jgi:Helix-turn-helix family
VTPILARKMWRTLEPYHGMIYFAPQATEAYAALGIEGRAGYFASRSAAMGAVPAEVVIATFYNFDPRLVRAAIPAAWDAASPAALVDARLGAADAALRAMVGEDPLGAPEMAEAADLARRAAEACTPEGRPLYAAHAALPWADEPHLVLWQAVTRLREFRGDGHVAALVGEGLSPREALVTHGASGDGLVTLRLLQTTRGWSDEAWDETLADLRARGWLSGDDRLIADGAAVRDRVEARTDELAMAPWRGLGEDASDRLRGLVRPWSRAIVGSGAFADRGA